MQTHEPSPQRLPPVSAHRALLSQPHGQGPEVHRARDRPPRPRRSARNAAEKPDAGLDAHEHDHDGDDPARVGLRERVAVAHGYGVTWAIARLRVLIGVGVRRGLGCGVRRGPPGRDLPAAPYSPTSSRLITESVFRDARCPVRRWTSSPAGRRVVRAGGGSPCGQRRSSTRRHPVRRAESMLLVPWSSPTSWLCP